MGADGVVERLLMFLTTPKLWLNWKWEA